MRAFTETDQQIAYVAPIMYMAALSWNSHLNVFK